MTALTRRSLLRAGAAATAVTFVGGRPWAPAVAAGAAPSGAHLLRSSYSGRTGQVFKAASVDLRLVSVSDLAGAAHNSSLKGAESAFALEFTGPLDAVLQSGTHTLRHADLGTFDLFVSPVQQPQSTRRYEAVVDRSVGGPAPGKRLLRGVTVRRTARGVRAEITLAPDVGATRVHGRLLRAGKAIATAQRRVNEGRAALGFAAPDLPAGTYTLVLEIVDQRGAVAFRRKRVTIASGRPDRVPA